MSEKISLPLSILIAGLLIAGGVYLNGKITRSNPTSVQEQQLSSQNLSDLLRPVDGSDHILGNPKARILIVEYSDTECPFCKMFHSTLLSIMQDYGKGGTVAWVYRHDPIAELHTKSFHEAAAAECAASLGGNSKFWDYINKIYEITPSNDSLDPNELTTIAAEIDLSSNAFNTCLNSSQFDSKINSDIKNAQVLGVSGTPYSILIDTKTNEYYPIQGAYPYNTLKSAIDMILGS